MWGLHKTSCFFFGTRPEEAKSQAVLSDSYPRLIDQTLIPGTAKEDFADGDKVIDPHDFKNRGVMLRL